MFIFILMSLKGCFSICWFLDTSTAFDTDHFEIIIYIDFRFHSPVFSGSVCLWIGWLPKVTTFLASHLKNNSLYLLFSTSSCRQSYASSRATWTQLRPSLSSFSDISVQYYVTVCWNTSPNCGTVLLKPVYNCWNNTYAYKDKNTDVFNMGDMNRIIGRDIEPCTHQNYTTG